MIRSDRNVYVAGHVTPDVKEELITVSKRMGLSQSEFISEAIKEKLAKEGSDLTIRKHLDEEDVKLPFDPDQKDHFVGMAEEAAGWGGEEKSSDE